MGTNKGSQSLTAVNQCEERCRCVWLVSVRVLQSPAPQSGLPEPGLASPPLQVSVDELIWGRWECWSCRLHL